MPKTLIKSNPEFKKEKPQDNNYLQIAELFSDTVQGEGINAGFPATFLRLQGCTLECVWCDTLEVWRYGNPYSFDEIFTLFEQNGTIEGLKKGQHLILTGGSPLKQQERLVKFIEAFILKYGFKPYIEIENECVLEPKDISLYVDCWNNSPKLANSQMKERARYKPEIVKQVAQKQNSWFKFVVSSEQDWEEIKRDYLPLMKKEQIVLMPEGQTQEELHKHYEAVVNIAVRENVRMCDRFHVTIWNKKTGV